MVSAREVAKYFLLVAQADEDDLMSNLRLQKLLYYAQGFHLAIFDKPLFPESIEHWTHGPVVPEIYRAYRKYEDGGIPYSGDFDVTILDSQTKDLLDEVYKVYGRFTASGLRNLTHSEPPWQNTQDGAVITHKAMKDFFKTRLVDGEET